MGVKISESESENVLPRALKRLGPNQFADIPGRDAQHAEEPAQVILAQLKPEDFRMAQLAIAGLDKYQGYEDWLDERLALKFGLQISGLAVESVDIEVPAYLGWCRARRVSPNVQSLDLYARRLLAGR